MTRLLATATREQIGANVRAALEANGLTQQNLADALGRSQTVISDRLRGVTHFRVDELQIVARLTGTTLDELVATAPAERDDSTTYCVGLPVVVTIHRQNGDTFVTVEVDLSDLGSRKTLAEALDNAGAEQDDEQLDRDADDLSIWTDTYAVTNEGWITR